MKNHSISVDQCRYATSIMDKYLDIATASRSKCFKTNLTYDMIFTKNGVSTSDEQVEKLSSLFNIHYRYCIVSLIDFYLQGYI